MAVLRQKWLVVPALVVLAGIAIGYRMYRRDISTLMGFAEAYKSFDQAMSDGSDADAALLALNARASERISSLIKNDAEFMTATRQIADIAGKELRAAKACRGASAAHQPALLSEIGDLRQKRKAAYTRFVDLAGVNKLP